MAFMRQSVVGCHNASCSIKKPQRMREYESLLCRTPVSKMEVATHCEICSRLFFVVLLLLGFIQPFHEGLQVTLEHLPALRTPGQKALQPRRLYT